MVSISTRSASIFCDVDFLILNSMFSTKTAYLSEIVYITDNSSHLKFNGFLGVKYPISIVYTKQLPAN